MANYVVSDTNLTSVADAIRAKGGTSAPLSFPTEFVSAIQAIPTGGGGGGDSSKPVRFLDYDGTVVQSYTAEEFAALEAMPENPDHSGDEIPLTAQGWNWSLADAKTYVAKYGALEVGQMYITTDGKTHIKIYIDPDTPANRRVMTLRWTQSVANGVTVDWGDGTEPESFSGTSAASHDHTYATTGWYDITLTVTDGTVKFGGGNTNTIIGDTSGANRSKCCMLRVLYFGTGLAVDAIKDYAFDRMQYLTNITMPLGLESISSYAFRECLNLAHVTIPSGVTRLVSGAFYVCRSLTSISFSSSVTSIGSDIFYSCRALERATIPNGVGQISYNSFYECSNLAVAIIPDSVTNIGNYAFYACYNLPRIVIPSSVTSMGNYTFQNCNSIRSVTLSGTITSVPNSTFSGCNTITGIEIPSAVTEISYNAFYNCSAMQNVLIPNGVTIIRDSAFSSCTSITKITIPNSVTTIGGGAFQNCYSVSEYHLLPTTPPTIQSNTFSNIPTDCVIYVPAASVEDYKAAANWSALASKIQAEPA